MSEILFVPLNTNHVSIFHAIILSLDRPYEILCHDRISESRKYRTEELLKKLGLPYRHLQNPVQRSLDDNLLSNVINFFRIRRELVQVVQEVSPRVIVMAIDNDPISQILLRESRRKGIHTVLVQEALIRPHEYTRRQTYLSDRFYGLIRASGVFLKYTMYGAGGCDRLLVGGRIARDILERRGIPKTRMEIVGHPKYDSMVKRLESFHAATDTKTYLYAASTKVVDDDAHVRFLMRLTQAASNLGIALIVKLHPRSAHEPSDIYGLLQMRPSPSLQIIKEGDDTLDILKRCHALVTVSSTVILDALMMDRECVLATYLAGESRMDYDAYDAIYSIEGEGQIDEVIQRSMIDKRSYRNKRRLLEDELYLLDGKAGERAAKAIVSMIPEAH